MSFGLRKFTLRLVGLFSVVLFLLGVAFFQSSQESAGLEVDFFDVGQGDAILIKTPDHQKILIDGGPDNAVVNKLGRSLPFYSKEIDLVILTHPHADHLTGLVEVLRRYKVKKILSTGVLHTTPEYIAWLEEIEKQKVPMEIAKAGQVINFGENSKIEIFNPIEYLAGKEISDLNNTSIVSKLTFGDTSFLFVGDAEKEVEEKLVSAEANLRADILKVAHHGSKNATSQEFLNRVKPTFAVILVGAENKFGHPTRLVINRLEKMGVRIFRTDEDGDVTFLSDSKNIEIKK